MPELDHRRLVLAHAFGWQDGFGAELEAMLNNERLAPPNVDGEEYELLRAEARSDYDVIYPTARTERDNAPRWQAYLNGWVHGHRAAGVLRTEFDTIYELLQGLRDDVNELLQRPV